MIQRPFALLLVTAALGCLFACVSPAGLAEQTSPDAVAQAPQNLTEQRIIAIGDVHGDFEQFVGLLKKVGLLDKALNWSGENAHLVQLGDIPDRGPDSRKTMDLLISLQTQAKEAGGDVTVLIGNHEAMMMTGDLRYVHAGEYESFKDRNSRKRRKAYYEQTIAHLKNTLPNNELPTFNRAYRKDWEQNFPLGYVEHRLAWAPTGEYGKWVLSRPAVAKVGDTVFVHGGISPNYAGMPIAEMNTRIRTDLAMGEQLPAESIVEDPNGPLWDRGWIRRSQNEENTAQLNQILADLNASRMVVAHTPLAPIIVPRFGGKVLLADVGLAEHYGSGFAALEIVGDEVNMLLGGEKVALPKNETEFDEYFDTAQSLLADPAKVIRYRELVEKAEAEANAEQTEQESQKQTGN